MKVVLTLLFTTLALSACKSTPEEDMSLPAGFAQLAQLMPLKRPVLTLTDDVWHQAIGPFQLTNMDLSGKSTEKVSTGSSWQSSGRGGLLFQLMFHDEVNVSGDVVNKFNTRAEQTFSFDLQAPAAAPVHVECQILAFGHGEETLDNGVNSYNWQTSEQQLSYLGCKLTQDGQVSTLVVEDHAGRAPTYRLFQGGQALTLSAVQLLPQLAQYNALFKGGESGYLVSDGQNTQAALQLSLDHSRLWVAKALPAATQQWYVAVLFSLQMYDWQR